MGNARRQRPFSFVRAAQALQDNVVRSGPVAAASYSLIGAILLLGGGGYLLDGRLGTKKPWFTVAGLLLGIVVGFYELIKATRPR
jgi:F0F1-type ATP synthase assembly protein I